ncbi:S-layer protein domain-containing protein [Methanolobus vulcani]|uniref:PGF-CTERM sorting domain-containing protein n=1 Tax=Methanolobus vulcani TaxID=38026 RepID=A0A7Z8KQF4_9EURY|nr:S-layer protein domain-containing protein [Methanolobus vulcani]TQD28202.1 PGF-CTERM sorting domain-containing protein [Methanolobus vulcani]
MKRFTTIALVALIALAALIAPAVAVEDTVEVRSEVFNGANFTEIFAAESGDIIINATNFAGFWYDLDEGLSSEELRIVNGSTDGDNVIYKEGGLYYNATIKQTSYECADFSVEPADTHPDDNDTFPIIGVFAEEYVPTADDDAGQLVKLLLDNDDKYTLTTGSALELAGGYELTAKQIDVDGEQVWMELSKDGEFVEDEVMDIDGNENTWDYEVDIGDEDDVIVFRVYVSDVFQGQVDSLAVVEGLWLVDYEDVLEIEEDDEFGELEVVTIDDTITMYNSNAITLSNDDTIDIAEGMTIETADSDAGDLRFYLIKEYTDAGTYEVRGSVAEGIGLATWDASTFAGFWYDLDADKSSETLNVTVTGTNTVAKEGGIWYNATIQQTDYECADFSVEPADTHPDDNDTFPIIGLFAEEYVPTADDDAGQLVKLLIDSDDKYTLTTGSALELAGGYELTAKQIDVDGEQVWMELSKDGEFVEDEVMDVAGDENTWDYEVDIGDEDDVIVFRVYVSDVFQGQVDSLAVVEGLWLVDYEDVLEVEEDDEFGELEVVTIDDTITMYNSNAITLSSDKTIDLAEDMKLKTADNDTLRYYPFVERTIGESAPVTEETPEETPEETTEEVTEETPEEVTEETTEEVTEETTEEAEDTTEPVEEDSPGFEAVFAVAGLLAVAYLVRRN